MSKLILTLLLIFGAQGGMAWFFYRSRAVSHALWTDSDFVVFGLPLVVGFAVSAGVLFLSLPQICTSKRMAATLGLSGVGAVVSSFVGTVIAFNFVWHVGRTNRCSHRRGALVVPLRGSHPLARRGVSDRFGPSCHDCIARFVRFRAASSFPALGSCRG